MMWILYALSILGGLGVFMLCILVLSLFMGGDDPYERELFMMDEHDYMLDSMRQDLDDRPSNTTNNTLNVDARSVHKYDIRK